jgi:hypothetical protein
VRRLHAWFRVDKTGVGAIVISLGYGLAMNLQGQTATAPNGELVREAVEELKIVRHWAHAPDQ